ncbi:MAG: hypothetical protein ACXAEF_11245 [Candidatus Thorarchaeota archaeon]
METKGNTINLTIICPDSACGTKKEITVPADNLKQSASGIVTISISKGLVCDHSFQVFVDANGRVRGYKKPDFELSFTPEQESVDSTTQYEETERILSGAQVILGDELFFKILRSALYKLPLYTITDIPSIRHILEGFKQVLDPYIDTFAICTLTEYNRQYKEHLASSDNRSLVIAIDQRIIINQVFNSKYNSKKFALEKSILKMINLSLPNEETIRSLDAIFHDILDSVSRIKIDMEHEKIETKKDIKWRISKMVDKKLTLDVDVVEDIIRYRLGFDVDSYFRERSRVSEWGKGILDLTG